MSVRIAPTLAIIFLCATVAGWPPAERRGLLKVERTLIEIPITKSPTLFPEKIVIGPGGQIYLLDTELDRIFLLS